MVEAVGNDGVFICMGLGGCVSRGNADVGDVNVFGGVKVYFDGLEFK